MNLHLHRLWFHSFYVQAACFRIDRARFTAMAVRLPFSSGNAGPEETMH